VEPVAVRVRPASPADLPDLADVAARTFPLACPPAVKEADITAFIDENLSADRFVAYLTDPDRVVFVAEKEGRVLGYAMLIRGEPADPDVARAVPLRPSIEVSKIYVVPEGHGTGAAAALMAESLRLARADRYRCVWLGVNQQNLRAQRFYAKHGFAVTGTKTFRLGAGVEQDYVMVCRL
jgi:ribosomal protein S18 acetylase RimI-like enzyme